MAANVHDEDIVFPAIRDTVGEFVRLHAWNYVRLLISLIANDPVDDEDDDGNDDDLEKRVLVEADGSEETLSASEFDLLKVFAENPNRPLARDWLLETIGHREMEVFDRAMDLRITRIRRKVEKDPAHPEAIRTVRGVGYMFVPPKD